MINRAGKAAELPDRDLGAGLGRLPGLLAPGLEEAVARGAVSAEEAATLTVDSLIVPGYGGLIYFPTNEGVITLRVKPATVSHARAQTRDLDMNDLLASGPDLAVIPTVTALAIKHFKQQGKDVEGAQLKPKHPAVRFLLGAWNDGDFNEAHKHIAPDISIYTNGRSFTTEGGGPAMAKESIESWRALAPDVRMELTQEIREKNRIAIEFRITGTHTGDVPGLPASGEAIDVEGTAFMTLSGNKITEVWTVFDSLAVAVQTGAVEAPAWWPGRS